MDARGGCWDGLVGAVVATPTQAPPKSDPLNRTTPDLEGHGDRRALTERDLKGVAQDVTGHHHAPHHDHQKQERAECGRIGLVGTGGVEASGITAITPITTPLPSSAVAD